MNQRKIEGSFRDSADTFIHMANVFCDMAPRGKVSANLLYAAAGLNSSIVVASVNTCAELRRDMNKVFEHFDGQYREILDENLVDYIQNFNEYMIENDSEQFTGWRLAVFPGL